LTRLSVFVTVGMGPWPFDRLIAALGPVCTRHEVFAQAGTSSLTPPCSYAPFLGWAETQARLASADVVITHAGNTVRLVQRMGKVPIAIAREAVRGEMRNDHQVEYLAAERLLGRVVALDGSLDALGAAVDGHPAAERAMLAVAPPLARLDGAALAGLLAQVSDVVTGQRDWLGAQVGDPHLDLRSGLRSARPPGLLSGVRWGLPPGRLSGVGPGREPGSGVRPGREPGSGVGLGRGLGSGSVAADGSLGSVAIRWPSGRARLGEVRRWLRPGGVLLVEGGPRDRDEVLAALAGAGFTPHWCDGGNVSAIRSGEVR
jgi:UDP-N-acetylglucosamine transferase subunit ALG13